MDDDIEEVEASPDDDIEVEEVDDDIEEEVVDDDIEEEEVGVCFVIVLWFAFRYLLIPFVVCIAIPIDPLCVFYARVACIDRRLT